MDCDSDSSGGDPSPVQRSMSFGSSSMQPAMQRAMSFGSDDAYSPAATNRHLSMVEEDGGANDLTPVGGGGGGMEVDSADISPMDAIADSAADARRRMHFTDGKGPMAPPNPPNFATHGDAAPSLVRCDQFPREFQQDFGQPTRNGSHQRLVDQAGASAFGGGAGAMGALHGGCPPQTARKTRQPHSRTGPTLQRTNTLDVTKVLVTIYGGGGSSASSSGMEASFDARFTNLGEIGSGSFATVFKVRSKIDGQLYAVKKGKEPFRGRRDRLAQLREMTVMEKIAKEHARKGGPCAFIVQYLQAWQEGNVLYEQCELCERGSIKAFMGSLHRRSVALPENTFWIWVGHAVEGLRYIHDCGIVHLDIKPHNLLLSADGVCKLADFGMATDAGSTEDGLEGDCQFMAKELLSGGPLQRSADIFSLGLALLDVAAAPGTELPMEGEGWHKLRDDPQSLVSGPGALPLAFAAQGLQLLVPPMMNPDPTCRPTAADVLTFDFVKPLLGVKDIFVPHLRDSPVPRPNLSLAVQTTGLGGSGEYDMFTPKAPSLITPLSHLPPSHNWS